MKSYFEFSSIDLHGLANNCEAFKCNIRRACLMSLRPLNRMMVEKSNSTLLRVNRVVTYLNQWVNSQCLKLHEMEKQAEETHAEELEKARMDSEGGAMMASTAS